MPSSTNPTFEWAVPGQKEPPKKPSPATTKPIANPLLSQSFSASAASNLRVPFSPVENSGLRQRHQQEASIPNNRTAGPTNGKRPVCPPTASFLVNGDVGVSNERSQPSTTTGASTIPQLVNNSLDRWVVVYGYANEAQYDAIVRKFSSFGKVVSHRGSCCPGRSNWIALEYESIVQAEKALCQQNCLLMDGVIVGVTRLTLSLKQSLEWNSTLLSSLPDVASRLDSKFQQNDAMKEEDILLMATPKKNREHGGKRNVCEKFLSWWFGWA